MTGWNDVGWHNPDIKTPNLDRMAEAGVILNASYVHPICTPYVIDWWCSYFYSNCNYNKRNHIKIYRIRGCIVRGFIALAFFIILFFRSRNSFLTGVYPFRVGLSVSLIFKLANILSVSLHGANVKILPNITNTVKS